MIGLSYIHDWTVATLNEFVLEQEPEIQQAARQYYKKEYEEFIEEMGKENYKTEADMWEAFVFDLRDNCDSIGEEMECILDRYIEMKKIPCAATEWHYDEHDDIYRLYIFQVVPHEIEDLKELIEMYMKEQGKDDVAEFVTEALLHDIK